MTAQERPLHRAIAFHLCLLAAAGWTGGAVAQTPPQAVAPSAPAPPPPPAATGPVAPSPAPAAAAPVAAPPPAAPPPAAPPSAISSSAAPFSAEETSRAALRAYVAEDDAGALRLIQDGLSRCDVVSRRECPDSAKALLLRDLGIVQAGAYRDHAASVKAFREALHLDGAISIPPDLLVDRVREAFVEAGGKAAPAEVTPAEPTEAAASTTSPKQPTDGSEKPSRYDPGDTFLLVVGNWGGSSDMTGNFNGEIGAAVSGAWHVTGPLAVGARVNAGGTVDSSTTMNNAVVGPYGIVGAAALIGVVPRGKRNTGYVLLGFGPDYAPDLDRARTVVSLAAGVSFGGFTFGGMPAAIFNQGRTYGGMWFFIGWGNYVKD